MLAYAHPLFAPGEWAELTRPGTPLHWVVINVHRGPGVRPDPLFLDAAARLREAGVRLLGLLDAARGGRRAGELLPEAGRYLEWYRVDGYYLDRAPLDGHALEEYRRTVARLRALTGRAHIVSGHGAYPDPGYLEAADQLVTFEGPWSRYRWAQPAAWTENHPPERFCHLVHGVPRAHMETALRLARWQGAATVHLTDRTGADPWEGLPGYWAQQVRSVRDGPPPCTG
ncbi:spherulation-specific family 4 protein [Wenjunlia tyrosinilytica]|uniref:spherulation-specific family 4 protein n=1 Tax=Wenjunlia tyrosinilytica TaxID=1544741 RepID=UPI001E4D2C88|nr:spherulation-specific family 4 protein [Wenjunlia tyrosinilytica]